MSNSLIGAIRTAQLIARKAKDAARAKTLTYLIGEVERSTIKDAQSDTNVEVLLKRVQKQIAKAYGEDNYDVTLIAEFLPSVVTGDALRAIIEPLVAGRNMGQAMKAIKDTMAERGFGYDGKEASTIVRELI